MFYDEPTTGLDPITTRIIHQLIADLQQQNKFTSIIISHDVEVFNYADYVALLHDGKIAYFGEAKTIWESTNPYIYQFIRGNMEGPIQSEIPHTTRIS
jgi:phospholipid/cholesterol/gamma-HCH transport system ATP-binding protein